MQRTTARGREVLAALETAAVERRCACARTHTERVAFRRRVASGEVVEPLPGLFATRFLWDTLNPGDRMRYLMRGWSHADPDVVFCHFSAALMFGLPVNYRLLTHLHLAERYHASSVPEGLVRRHEMRDLTPVRVDGVLVSPELATVVDCLRTTPLVDGLPLADAELRRINVERELFEEMVRRLGAKRSGVRQARRMAALADGRTENGGESVARAIMIEEGIPPTSLQDTVGDPVSPGRRFRPDFVFLGRDGSITLAELDGIDKYADETMRAGRSAAEVVRAERQRESRLTMLGLPVVRFTMADVWRPGRLRYLLACAGVTPATIVPYDYRTTAPSAALFQQGRASWATWRGAGCLARVPATPSSTM